MKNQNQVPTETETSRDTIALRAYRLWETAGYPPGHDMEHWLQAEAELAAVSQQGFTKSVSPGASPKPGPARSAAAPRPQPQFARPNERKGESRLIGIPRNGPDYTAPA